MPSSPPGPARTDRRTYTPDAQVIMVGIAIVTMCFPRTLVTIGRETGDYETSAILFVSDLPFLALIAVRVASIRRHRPKRLGAGAAGWLALTAVLTVALVFHPSARGVLTVLRFAGVVALADAIRQLPRPTGRRSVAGVVGVVAAFETVVAIAQRLHNGPIGLGRLGEDPAPLYRSFGSPAPQGTMVHIYVLAGLALVAGTVLARWATTDTDWRLWGLGAVVAIAPVGVTYSRAALLGLLLAGAALVLAWPPLPVKQPARLAAAGALALGALIPAAIWSGGWRARAHQTVGTPSGGSVSTSRGHLTHEARTLISHNPFVGVGPGRYVLALQKLQHAETDPAVGIFKPVHDLPLLAGAEGGLLAGAAVVVLLGVVGWRALRTDAAALAVYLALMPFLLFDHFAYSLPQGLVILGVWLGLLDGWYADRVEVSAS